ncbi:MAG TPA: plasmid pRiA4b ORF-3 family protein [Streptosporangiaceae bacterium]|nr:plasmid pRiA4b ORF-3 family protein [Streptosporangiaceae bacterium]
MIPQPSLVSSELAEAALSCVPLARARELATWVGSGRELTSSGVLRPAAAAEACRVLGIELPPGRLRTAKDVPELMRDWEVAVTAGFIEPGASRVYAAGDLADLGPANAERVLRSWVWSASGQLGLPYDPCAGCLTVLHELSVAGGPVPMADLEEAVRSLSEAGEAGAVAGAPCPDCGEVHDVLSFAGLLGIDDDDDDGDHADFSWEHTEAAVAWLVSFGAAATGPSATPGGSVRLTPLGRMLAESVFSGCAPAPEDGAGTLVTVISVLPPKIATEMARPWLAERSPVDAVRELLGYAESADPDQRMVALALAREIGPAAAQAWRESAGRPGFGAYARRWLAGQGEPVAEDPRDEAWLTVEAMSLASAAVPPELVPLVFGAAVQHAATSDVAETLALMNASGHPDAARLVESVASLTGLRVPESLAGTDVYQLKITLRGVSKPPVWRRVLVPASMTLDLLHEVILRAMGWGGGHLHVFSDGWREYGSPDAELGHADERWVTVADLLSGPGGTVTYTYDFGDDWEHGILLEKILPAGPGAAYPVCVAGKGACPPEDCGGAWGYAELKKILADPDHEQHEEMLEWLGLDDAAEFDPAEFSVDEVNERLTVLR